MMQKGARIAVFVDRDGPMYFDKHHRSDPNGLELIPTVAEGVRKLNGAGIPVIVVTNQSGIARGQSDEKQLVEIHARPREFLASKEARIYDISFCPHMPDAGCRCRKPSERSS